MANQRRHGGCKMRRESEKGSANQAQNQLLAPIAARHFRKQAKAVMDEIATMDRRNNQKQADPSPAQEHQAIENDDAKQTAH